MSPPDSRPENSPCILLAGSRVAGLHACDYVLPSLLDGEDGITESLEFERKVFLGDRFRHAVVRKRHLRKVIQELLMYSVAKPEFFSEVRVNIYPSQAYRFLAAHDHSTNDFIR
jgi:hypothetical protein